MAASPQPPRKITDEQVEEVIVRTLEGRPPGEHTRRSTRSLARAAGLSETAVSRIWPATCPSVATLCHSSIASCN